MMCGLERGVAMQDLRAPRGNAEGCATKPRSARRARTSRRRRDPFHRRAAVQSRCARGAGPSRPSRPRGRNLPQAGGWGSRLTVAGRGAEHCHCHGPAGPCAPAARRGGCSQRKRRQQSGGGAGGVHSAAAGGPSADCPAHGAHGATAGPCPPRHGSAAVRWLAHRGRRRRGPGWPRPSRGIS